MGLISEGARKAAEQIAQKEAEQRQRDEFAKGRNAELLAAINDDKDEIDRLGFKIEADEEGEIAFFSKKASQADPRLVVGYSSANKTYLVVVGRETPKAFKDRSETLLKIGQILQEISAGVYREGTK